MSMTIPPVPRGTGQHPVVMVTVAATNLAASVAFYRTVFGWPFMSLSVELASAPMAAGPMVTLRTGTASAAQGVVPFIAVQQVETALSRVVEAGGAIERAPWPGPMVGTLARFTDPAGTVYGLMSAATPAPMPHQPAPFGDAPRPPAGTICSLELHAGDLTTAAAFFTAQFGWGTLPTMPQYCMFDAGAGVGGVWQSHTPANRGLAYVYVSDVAATLAAITAAGGKALGEPMAMPGMATFGYFTDPSGTAMGLMG
jgi:predicted enzyme related to lactoylglutathione lyase